MLHFHHRQRGCSFFIRERNRIRYLFLVAVLLLSFLGIREAHDDPASSASSSNDARANSYLLLCLTDGSIYSVQAWTGEYESSILTEPLLQTHRTTASTDIVLPGLDGRLYWRPPSPHTDNEHGAPPIQQQPLQELPLTVQALLENPVRSCDPTESTSSGSKTSTSSTLEDCGILTAEAVTSLLALTEKGTLLWKTRGGSGGSNTPTEAEASGRSNILLLQRKDYWVQHVLASTGQQSWNVSMGTYQALDFGLPTEEDTLLLDDDDDILNDRDDHHGGPPLLPAVVFSNQGRTVTAIDPVHSTALWRQHVPSTLSAIFGISAGQWKTVQVVTASEFMEEQQHHDTERPMLPSFSQQEQQQHELERFLWTQHQQQWTGNQHQQTYQYPLGLPSSKSEENNNNNRKGTEGQGMTQRPDNNNDNDVCLVNGEIVEGSCPNLYVPHLLYLPSPTAPVITKASPVSVASDGLLLSWSLVTALVVVLVVTVAIGRFWYVRKKAKWLTESGQRRPSIDESHELSSSSFSLHGGRSRKHIQQHPQQHNLRRSSSLPGVLGSPDPLRDVPQPTVLSPPIVVPNSDDGKILLWTPPQLPTLPGGTTIPLVRYSRYASEFIELRALGRGGFGSVFQCTNALDGRDYAIKKVSIRSSGGSSSSRETVFQQQLERVLREVKILAVLDHPNIVRYYTAWLEIDAGEATAAESETTSNHHIKNQSRSALEYDDDQSCCFSSSLLLDTESVSGWGMTTRNGSSNNNNSNHHQYMTKSNDPFGWSDTGFDMESEPSKNASSSMFATKRRSFKPTSFDNLVVFAEESYEDKGDGSISNATSKIGEPSSANLENASPLLPRRRSFSLGEASDTLLSRSKSSTLVKSSDLSADIMTREIGSSAGLSLRHTLYIQMQLCSHKTVAEFLADTEARRGPDSTTHAGVDIPKALRLFLQIAEAVKHVHSQSLIHRDLKPSNCFMDDSGATVKVGDFGLSRESTFLSDVDMLEVDKGESVDASRTQSKMKNASTPPVCGSDDHTAGVGTRSYASPEQLNGSAYDSSTDVYSLGIMLFELLYPMYTGMERNICLSRLHNHIFPNDWEESVGKVFPTMRGLIVGMLSISPSARPTADSVARHVQSVLGEFTILSLDTEHYFNNNPDVVLLRVEAEHRDNTLSHTMHLIRDESVASHGCPVEIVQYGLRSSNSSSDNNSGPATAIMEFALRFQDNVVAVSDAADALHSSAAAQLVSKLRLHPEIFKVRQVAGRRVPESLTTHG